MLKKLLAALGGTALFFILSVHLPFSSAASNDPVDMKMLVIAGSGTEPSFLAITAYLNRIGVPHDTLIGKNIDLTADLLSRTGKGYYQGIILATSNLGYESAPGVWVSAFDWTEWQTLWNYEIQFGIRELAYFAFPGAWPNDYGLSLAGTADTSSAPLQTTLTDPGKTVFNYIKPDATIPIRYAWTYLANPIDSQTQPLLLSPSGQVVAAIRNYTDGREAMAMTMDQNTNPIHSLHSLLLNYGAVRWVSKGKFLGQRHIYHSPQEDDLFIPNDLWGPVKLSDEVPGLEYRVTGDDLTKLANWQNAIRSTPTGADFQVEHAFNGVGTLPGEFPGDTLTPTARTLQNSFAWLNHTWTHMNLDSTTDEEVIYEELNNNISLAADWPLTKYNPAALVTPDISGLTNPTFLEVASEEGIQFLVCDTSRPGCAPTFNTAVPNPMSPALLQVPRYPTSIFYSSSTPLEETSRYNHIYRSYWGRDLTYQEIIDLEGSTYLGYMLSYSVFPLMFHQANLRAYDGVNSVMGDAIGRAFQKYNQYSTLPVQSLTLAEIAGKTQERMAYDSSGAGATLDRANNAITIVAAPDSVIPVTGVNQGTNVESYGGDWISYITIPASGSTTVSLPAGAGPGAHGTVYADDPLLPEKKSLKDRAAGRPKASKKGPGNAQQMQYGKIEPPPLPPPPPPDSLHPHRHDHKKPKK